MTDKQKKFADEYLIDCNATRAYKVAYPNIKKDEVAAAAGARLLRNVKVADYINGLLDDLHTERTADAQEIIEYLTTVLRGESQAQELVVEGCGEGRSTARSIYKRPSEKDKLKAAELLGRRYGLFTESVNLNGDMSLNISIDYGADDEK